MAVDRAGGFNLSNKDFGKTTVKMKKERQNNRTNFIPGTIAGLAAGGATHATLSRVAKNADGVAARQGFVSRTIGSLAKGAERTFNPDRLINVAKSRGGRLKTSVAVGLGTIAGATGIYEAVRGIFSGIAGALDRVGGQKQPEENIYAR